MKQQPVIQYTVKSMFEEAARPLRAKIKKLSTEISDRKLDYRRSQAEIDRLRAERLELADAVIQKNAEIASLRRENENLSTKVSEQGELIHGLESGALNGRLRRENKALVEALHSAPEPTAEHAWVLKYVEWHSKARSAALRSATETPSTSAHPSTRAHPSTSAHPSTRAQEGESLGIDDEGREWKLWGEPT